MTMDLLLEFRKVYLRAIAEAWSDPVFSGKLTEDPLDALEMKFGYDWPWEDWWDLEVVQSPPGSYWDSKDNEWIWSRNQLECMTIYLPLAPRKSNVDDKDRAKALADFYQQRPVMFGDLPSGSGGKAFEGGLMPADQDFSALRVALMAAMARAWDDSSFRMILTTNATTALNRIPGYKVPWDFTINVKDDVKITSMEDGLQEERPRWTPPGPSLSAGSNWSAPANKNVLTLYLPTKPDKDVQGHAVALAMYNATGARYPFTCTC